MHDPTVVSAVLDLVARGLNDCQISRHLDVPRSTVREWRHGLVPKEREKCSICRKDPTGLPFEDYSYLLGLYLGDGCISKHRRTYRLRIVLDAKYPGIILSCARAIEAIRPGRPAWIGGPREGCVEVGRGWNHWPCLFPQHGPGKKHRRQIQLAPWQEQIVSRAREAFVRGLIHSDGCRTVANDRGRPSVRYHFSNLSEDIKKLYCQSLDALGIPWTRPSEKDIAVYRRAAAARMDEFIGRKK